jgi:formamidopyrimidine-DNA glycosylase
MPELPEVETVRRSLEETVRGRTIRGVRLSGKRLREPIPPRLPRQLRGRTITAVDRHGKYLLVRLDAGVTLLSHLGMSGSWLFHETAPARAPDHLHVRIAFTDGSVLWFQDPRRFGLLRLLAGGDDRDPALTQLGPDPMRTPPSGPDLHRAGRGSRTSIKTFLLDQRRVAGIGNIYASEILHRAGIDPRRNAGALNAVEWTVIAREIPAVLGEAIRGFGTTFRSYRTLWDEPGTYGERLLVYDRAGDPCRRCGTAIRRVVLGQRSTYFCPLCQPRRKASKRPTSGPGNASRARSRAAARPRR